MGGHRGIGAPVSRASKKFILRRADMNRSRVVGKRPMLELHYRESRVARAMGEPAKFAIVDLLLKRGPSTLSEVAHGIHRSKTATCYHMARLKALEIVRFETKGNGVYYWVKYRRELSQIIRSLTIFVNRSLKGVRNEM